MLTVLCCSCPQSLPTGQTSPLLAGSLSTASAAVYCSIFHLPAAFSPAGRSFLTTNHTRPFSPQKKIIFATIRTFSFLFLLLSLISRCRMSKSSTATAPKISTPLPAKSAWARGPPQSAAPSPRSQSPAPSTPVLQTHSRRPSTLGQGIPIKDGVSIPRNNVGVVKQGLSFSSFFLKFLIFSARLSRDFWINR